MLHFPACFVLNHTLSGAKYLEPWRYTPGTSPNTATFYNGFECSLRS